MLMKTTVAPTPSLAGKSGITLDALRVSYHGNVVLKPLTLTIEPGEVLALIGPSGSGKTTVLRAIAGFVQPAGGRILLGDTDPPAAVSTRPWYGGSKLRPVSAHEGRR